MPQDADVLIERTMTLYWRTAGLLLRRRLRNTLGDISILSSNCVGGRLSELAGEPYRSPTVGLWFWADDFLKFAADIAGYRAEPVIHDLDESERLGYPVGRLADVRILFLHYPTFAEALEKWKRRIERLDLTKILLVHTDREATQENLEAFDSLPYPKLLFVSKPQRHLKSALWIRHGNEANQVGDLTTHWQYLAPVLSRHKLKSVSRRGH